jgi:hypothetical protein
MIDVSERLPLYIRLRISISPSSGVSKSAQHCERSPCALSAHNLRSHSHAGNCSLCANVRSYPVSSMEEEAARCYCEMLRSANNSVMCNVCGHKCCILALLM